MLIECKTRFFSHAEPHLLNQAAVEPHPLATGCSAMEDHIELNISTVGKRVVSTNAEREDVPLLKINTRQNLKKALTLFRGPQRLWSITLIALVTATFTMIGGYTLGYPSPSLLDLRNMTHGRSIKSGSIMENVYGVSLVIINKYFI